MSRSDNSASRDDAFTLFSNFPNTPTSQNGAALSAEQQTPGNCWAALEDIASQYDLITEPMKHGGGRITNLFSPLHSDPLVDG